MPYFYTRQYIKPGDKDATEQVKPKVILHTHNFGHSICPE